MFFSLSSNRNKSDSNTNITWTSFLMKQKWVSGVNHRPLAPGLLFFAESWVFMQCLSQVSFSLDLNPPATWGHFPEPASLGTDFVMQLIAHVTCRAVDERGYIPDARRWGISRYPASAAALHASTQTNSNISFRQSSTTHPAATAATPRQTNCTIVIKVWIEVEEAYTARKWHQLPGTPNYWERQVTNLIKYYWRFRLECSDPSCNVSRIYFDFNGYTCS
jgi:hypothetical protein